MKRHHLWPVVAVLIFTACFDQAKRDAAGDAATAAIEEGDTVVVEEPRIKEILPSDIVLTKELLYDKYTLDDTYPYKDTTRVFQWEKAKEVIAKIENIQRDGPQPWAILKNRKNVNGEAPLVPNWSRNEYKNVADSLGVQRFQGIPLYLPNDSMPIRYGMDGELVRQGLNDDSSEFVNLQTVHVEGNFMVPRKYVHIIDTILLERVALVDRTNQNIATLEKSDNGWLIRSMNPATTGVHKPPYAHETPLGIFVIQEKKEKMFYLADGTGTIAGYAPYASRFSNGGYIHGIPTNSPKANLIEYSQTLGTIPRSHMCVRNASSHAEFVYDWAPVEKGLVVVVE